MSETSTAYEERLLKVDVKNDGIIDGINESRIKQQARDYVLEQKGTLTEKEFRELVDRIDTLLQRHNVDRIDLRKELDQAKQGVRGQTKKQINTVRELQLADIRSPAGLSHYIDRSGDEAMKILEKQIGLDNTWKILTLTTAHTSIELGKGLADILKIGEGITEGMVALDRTELSKKEKALEITKGIGIDGFRALGIVGGIFGKVLSKAKPSQIIVETGTKSVSQVPKFSTVELKEPLGARIWQKQRGAIGDLSRKKESSIVKGINALAEERNARPPKIGELITDFNPEKSSPEYVLARIENISSHLNVDELINTQNGIRNFAQTLENLSIYIGQNMEGINPLKRTYFQSIVELRGNIKQILTSPELTNDTRVMLMDTVSELDNTLITLNPRIGPIAE